MYSQTLYWIQPPGARFALFSRFESRPFGAGSLLLIQTQCSARLLPCCALGYRISPLWGYFRHPFPSNFSPGSGSGRPVAPIDIFSALLSTFLFPWKAFRDRSRTSKTPVLSEPDLFFLLANFRLTNGPSGIQREAPTGRDSIAQCAARRQPSGALGLQSLNPVSPKGARFEHREKQESRPVGAWRYDESQPRAAPSGFALVC